MLTELTPADPAFLELVPSSHQRFARLVHEADRKARGFYQKTLGRPAAIEEVVDEVFNAVEREGDAAVVRYSQAFDGSALPPDKWRVTPAELLSAWEACNPALRQAMQDAISQVTAYQRRLLPRGFGENLDQPLGVRWTAIPRWQC